MSHIDELETFRDFLIQRNCLENYIDLEYAHTNTYRDIPYLLSSAITNTAEWSRTKEGDNYWRNLHNIWQHANTTTTTCRVSVNEILNYLKSHPTNTPYEYW